MAWPYAVALSTTRSQPPPFVRYAPFLLNLALRSAGSTPEKVSKFAELCGSPLDPEITRLMKHIVDTFRPDAIAEAQRRVNEYNRNKL